LDDYALPQSWVFLFTVQGRLFDLTDFSLSAKSKGIGDMKTKSSGTNRSAKRADKQGKIAQPGYPLYPAREDIFSQYKEEGSINPEDISKTKEPNEDVKAGKNNEKDFEEDVSGSDLDVPGSELDDGEESIGKEDEENNFYSLGGDNHNDLDEDKGD